MSIIDELYEFKLRQIDENRKISRRVDELEYRLNHNPDIKKWDEYLNDTKNRLDKLEKLIECKNNSESGKAGQTFVRCSKCIGKGMLWE